MNPPTTGRQAHAHKMAAAPCPACGAPSQGHAHPDGDLTRAYYLCAAGHGWSATWLTANERHD